VVNVVGGKELLERSEIAVALNLVDHLADSCLVRFKLSGRRLSQREASRAGEDGASNMQPHT